MRFVVVTGMSGSGKSTAMKLLEDAGFFCVDNLPVPLIEKFMELLTMPNNEISKAALGLDVRAEQTFGDALKILDRMRQNGFIFEILFMDAADDVLVKRYKETRRAHPMGSDTMLIKNIQKYLRENLPVVPIANTQQVVGVRSDVQGFTPTPAASHFYDKVYFGTAEGTTAE